MTNSFFLMLILVTTRSSRVVSRLFALYQKLLNIFQSSFYSVSKYSPTKSIHLAIFMGGFVFPLQSMKKTYCWDTDLQLKSKPPWSPICRGHCLSWPPSSRLILHACPGLPKIWNLAIKGWWGYAGFKKLFCNLWKCGKVSQSLEAGILLHIFIPPA